MIVCSALGACCFFTLLWLQSPDPPSCTTLPDGRRACMPVLVVPPTPWDYAFWGVVGAMIGFVVGFVAQTIHGRLTGK